MLFLNNQLEKPVHNNEETYLKQSRSTLFEIKFFLFQQWFWKLSVLNGFTQYFTIKYTYVITAICIFLSPKIKLSFPTLLNFEYRVPSFWKRLGSLYTRHWCSLTGFTWYKNRMVTHSQSVCFTCCLYHGNPFSLCKRCGIKLASDKP